MENKSSGLGFWSVLQLLFIGLKLGGIIKWSWLWVLFPTWIPAIIIIIVVLAIFMVSDK